MGAAIGLASARQKVKRILDFGPNCETSYRHYTNIYQHYVSTYCKVWGLPLALQVLGRRWNGNIIVELWKVIKYLFTCFSSKVNNFDSNPFLFWPLDTIFSKTNKIQNTKNLCRPNKLLLTIGCSAMRLIHTLTFTSRGRRCRHCIVKYLNQGDQRNYCGQFLILPCICFCIFEILCTS